MNKILNKSIAIAPALAKIVSSVLSPYLIPTYVAVVSLWDSYLNVNPASSRAIITIVIFATTALLPMMVVAFLRAIKVVDTMRLEQQRDRTIPLSVAIICYCGAWQYLVHLHAPSWFSMFYLAAAIAAAITFAVNFRWKISIHAMGIGAFTSFCFFYCWLPITFHGDRSWFIASILMSGLICTSRLYLQRHTVAQVVGGYAVGIIAVVLTQFLSL